MNGLLDFQNSAVNKIVEFFDSNEKHARISISVGLGCSKIIVHAINKIYRLKIIIKITVLI